ncbi:hypothetical protein Efla_006681 [Eimeria flavescens]
MRLLDNVMRRGTVSRRLSERVEEERSHKGEQAESWTAECFQFPLQTVPAPSSNRYFAGEKLEARPAETAGTMDILRSDPFWAAHTQQPSEPTTPTFRAFVSPGSSQTYMYPDSLDGQPGEDVQLGFPRPVSTERFAQSSYEVRAGNGPTEALVLAPFPGTTPGVGYRRVDVDSAGGEQTSTEQGLHTSSGTGSAAVFEERLSHAEEVVSAAALLQTDLTQYSWWKEFTGLHDTAAILPGPSSGAQIALPAMAFNVHLVNRLSAALDILKRGVLPEKAEIRDLKLVIFCHKHALKDFRNARGSPWREAEKQYQAVPAVAGVGCDISLPLPAPRGLPLNTARFRQEKCFDYCICGHLPAEPERSPTMRNKSAVAFAAQTAILMRSSWLLTHGNSVKLVPQPLAPRPPRLLPLIHTRVLAALVVSLAVAYVLLTCMRQLFSSFKLNGRQQRLLASNFPSDGAESCSLPEGGGEEANPPASEEEGAGSEVYGAPAAEQEEEEAAGGGAAAAAGDGGGGRGGGEEEEEEEELEGAVGGAPPHRPNRVLPPELLAAAEEALQMMEQAVAAFRGVMRVISPLHALASARALGRFLLFEASAFSTLPPTLQPARARAVQAFADLINELVNTGPTAFHARERSWAAYLLTLRTLLERVAVANPCSEKVSLHTYVNLSKDNIQLSSWAFANVIQSLNFMQQVSRPHRTFISNDLVYSRIQMLNALQTVRRAQVLNHSLLRFCIETQQSKIWSGFAFDKTMLQRAKSANLGTVEDQMQQITHTVLANTGHLAALPGPVQRVQQYQQQQLQQRQLQRQLMPHPLQALHPHQRATLQMQQGQQQLQQHALLMQQQQQQQALLMQQQQQQQALLMQQQEQQQALLMQQQEQRQALLMQQQQQQRLLRQQQAQIAQQQQILYQQQQHIMEQQRQQRLLQQQQQVLLQQQQLLQQMQQQMLGMFPHQPPQGHAQPPAHLPGPLQPESISQVTYFPAGYPDAEATDGGQAAGSSKQRHAGFPSASRDLPPYTDAGPSSAAAGDAGGAAAAAPGVSQSASTSAAAGPGEDPDDEYKQREEDLEALYQLLMRGETEDEASDEEGRMK